MSETSDDGRRAARGGARRVLVTATSQASQTSVDGWCVRRDLVVVLTADLGPDPVDTAQLSVTIGRRTVHPVAVHHQTVDAVDGRSWTALVLPDGTLALEGDHHPPGLGPISASAGTTAHRSHPHGSRPRASQGNWWCSIFPEAPGC